MQEQSEEHIGRYNNGQRSLLACAMDLLTADNRLSVRGTKGGNSEFLQTQNESRTTPF